jgi:hypothetical protein
VTVRIPSALVDATRRADVAATEAALGAPDLPPLAALFSFAMQLGPSAATFVVLHHVAMAEPPTEAAARREWLFALNNACALGCAFGTTEQRAAIAERAIAVATENVPIFHNAACLFCVLGRADDALACVKGAVDHGYEHMAKLADDEDLDLVRTRPEFAAIVGARATVDRDDRARRLADLSRALFRGEDVPAELAAFWQEQWFPTGIELPASIRMLHSVRPAQLGRLSLWLEHPIVGDEYRALLDRLDIVGDDGDRRSKTYVGYYRGRDRTLPLAKSPIVEVCESGAIRVTARSLYEHLVIANHDRAVRELVRVESLRAHGQQSLENIMRNAGVSVPTCDVDVAREAARAIADDPLLDLADEMPEDSTMSPALAELVRACEQLGDGPHRRAAFVELQMRPWSRNALVRVGGPCIGVALEDRYAPISPLVHLMTLDASQLGGSSTVAVFANLFHHDRGPGFAMARFAVDSVKTVAVTDASIAEHGEQSGPLDGDFQELPRARPVVALVELPARLLEDHSRGLWAALEPKPGDDGAALPTRFLVWHEADELRVDVVPAARAEEERFFEAVAREYAAAGYDVELPADEDIAFGEWLKELETSVEDGPPEFSPGGRRERYSDGAPPDRIALHKKVMAAWFEPAVAILAQLLTHPSTHVRTWTALSITGLFEDHVQYDMYSESVGDHFRSIAGDMLGGRANPRTLVAALIEAFPPSGEDVDHGDEYTYARHGVTFSAVADALVRAVITCIHAERKDKQRAYEAASDAVTFVLDRVEAGDDSMVDIGVRLGTAVRDHEAARHLAALVDARGAAALVFAAGEPDPERAAVRLRVLAAFGDRRGAPMLRELVARVGETERGAIADSLRHLKATDAVPELLVALRETVGRTARIAIVHALTVLGDESVGAIARADIVARPLELERYKSHADVREAAVKAASAGAVEARAFLVTMTERGQTDTPALRALGMLRATEAVPALIELATNGPSYHRGEALAALAAIGDERAEGVLFAALVQREDEWNIEHGARGMARLGRSTPDVEDALIAAAGEKNHLARIAALEALGDLGIARGVAPALANVGDGHTTIARTAAVTLQQLAPGSDHGVDLILDELKHFRRDYERGNVHEEWKMRADRLVAALEHAPGSPVVTRLRAALAWYPARVAESACDHRDENGAVLLIFSRDGARCSRCGANVV